MRDIHRITSPLSLTPISDETVTTERAVGTSVSFSPIVEWEDVPTLFILTLETYIPLPPRPLCTFLVLVSSFLSSFWPFNLDLPI